MRCVMSGDGDGKTWCEVWEDLVKSRGGLGARFENTWLQAPVFIASSTGVKSIERIAILHRCLIRLRRTNRQPMNEALTEDGLDRAMP